jgi:hypothetical protein
MRQCSATLLFSVRQRTLRARARYDRPTITTLGQGRLAARRTCIAVTGLGIRFGKTNSSHAGAFLGRVIVGGIRVVLGVVVQTAHADNHKHNLPLESTSDSAAPAKQPHPFAEPSDRSAH